MPGGVAHKVSDFDPALAQGGDAMMTPEQHDALVDLLNEQHKEIVALLKPVHDVAVLILSDRAEHKAAG